MRSTPGFEFVDSPADFRDATALIVRVPAGVRSKQKLLAVLADKLHFPGYFGWNWDALEECLRDLSWLPDGRAIVIVHEELPFGPGGKNRGVYVSLLNDVAAHWVGRKDRAVKIVFPRADQAAVNLAANSPR